MRRFIQILSAALMLLLSRPASAASATGYDAFLPGSETPKSGYDLVGFDALFPEGELWQSGFTAEAQIGASLFKYASLGIGFGLGSLIMDEELMLARAAPLVPNDRADYYTLSIRGNTVAFSVGPSVWIETFPASFMAVTVEAGLRYAYFPLTPSVEGEKEDTLGPKEDEIEIMGEEIEWERIEYTTEYGEEIEINSAVYGRVGLQIELGRPGDIAGFLGVAKILDIAPPEATFRGISLGLYGVQGLAGRVGFRTVW
ncbi:MAG: hypothetical protein FJ225_01590 [Lentisphaerae bacterium]|nr:hypothetical protein [Lentisphaerota bacterium]